MRRSSGGAETPPQSPRNVNIWGVTGCSMHSPPPPSPPRFHHVCFVRLVKGTTLNITRRKSVMKFTTSPSPRNCPMSGLIHSQILNAFGDAGTLTASLWIPEPDSWLEEGSERGPCVPGQITVAVQGKGGMRSAFCLQDMLLLRFR